MITRFTMVALNGGNLLIKAISGLLSAWIVVHFAKVEIWGEFTNYWVLLSLLSTISSFGNKEFVIREMSKHPSAADSIWNNSTYSRLLLLIPLVPIFLFCFIDSNLLILSSAWLVLNFIQQSFESIAVFEKRFRTAFIIEFMGAIVTFSYLIKSLGTLKSDQLLAAFVLGQFLKTCLTLIVYRVHVRWPQTDYFSIKQLSRLLPFFLLGIGGFLIDKSDLICVNIYLDSDQKASYQILSNTCTMGMVAASLVLIPFSKNIYRLNSKTFQKFNKSYALFGFCFSLVFIAATFILMKFIYQLDFGYDVYFWFFVNLLSYTLFLPKMYFFTQQNEQVLALKIILFAAVSTFLMAFILVKLYAVSGAAFSCAAGQLTLLALSYWFVKIRSKLVKQA